jgi:hypothetical protein
MANSVTAYLSRSFESSSFERRGLEAGLDGAAIDRHHFTEFSASGRCVDANIGTAFHASKDVDPMNSAINRHIAFFVYPASSCSI